MIETVPLELGYKGARNYLHGTDMYNAILEHLGRLAPQHLQGQVKMVIHDFSHHQCDMLYRVGAERCPRPEQARLEFYLGDRVSGDRKSVV